MAYQRRPVGLQSGFAEPKRYPWACVWSERQNVVQNLVGINEETVGALLAAWTLEKIDMDCQQDASWARVEPPSTDLRTVRKLVSTQVPLQSELCSAQETPSHLVAW